MSKKQPQKSERSLRLFLTLQKLDASLPAGTNRFLIPDAGLHLANVRATHQQHAQARLSNTAANGLRQLPTE